MNNFATKQIQTERSAVKSSVNFGAHAAKPFFSAPAQIQAKFTKVAGNNPRQDCIDTVQRTAGSANESHDISLPPIVNEVLRSPGQPLDSSAREYMEPRFGHDFSNVRVHTDARAAESAQAIDAIAYTGGRSIVFDRGRYSPASTEGRSLLAHELTHVVQQRAGVQLKNGVGQVGDIYEQQADAMAALVNNGANDSALHGLLLKTSHSNNSGTAEAPFLSNGTQPVQMQTRTGSAVKSVGGTLKSPSSATFAFQTFIPDRFVPGGMGLAYGDSRGFGKPGDSYRTFQQIVVEPDQALNTQGIITPAIALTGFSKTAITLVSGHSPSAPLKMMARRRDANSVTVVFQGSITNGAKFGGGLAAIDFTGWINIFRGNTKPTYVMSIRHDAFPAYEAFINGDPIYRWCYPASSTVDKLDGVGSIADTRRTGDATGGVIGHRPKVLLQEIKRKRYPKGVEYVVKPGDTLSKIALENLGAASRADEIYDENRDVIGDETHVLRVGMKLIVHKPVDVHSLAEAMLSATDPQGGLMRIKGEALDYIMKHQTSESFRRDFERHLRDQISLRLKYGDAVGNLEGVYDQRSFGASSYGGDLSLADIKNWATLGTFLIGHCYPEVRYHAKFKGDRNGGTVEWIGIWVINDNLDLVGGSDKGGIYNWVSTFATLGWHDLLGGRKRAHLQAKWHDKGSIIIPSTWQVFTAVADKTRVAKPTSVMIAEQYFKDHPSTGGGTR